MGTIEIKESISINELEDISQSYLEDKKYDKARILRNIIIETFKHKYDWLGEQVADELLDSLALHIINKNYKGLEYDIRMHLMLIWRPGFYKSTILKQFTRYFLPDIINSSSDDMRTEVVYSPVDFVNEAVLKGSVDKVGNKYVFVPSPLMNTHIIVIEEFGALLSTEPKVLGPWLKVLQDGELTNELIKLSKLSKEEREVASELYGVEWLGINKYKFRTISTIWAANYTEINDLALMSRFRIITPRQELTTRFKAECDSRPFKFINPDINNGEGPENFDEARMWMDVIINNHRPEIYQTVTGIEELLVGLDGRLQTQVRNKIIAAQFWGVPITRDIIRGWAMDTLNMRLTENIDIEYMIHKMMLRGWVSVPSIAREFNIPFGQANKLLMKLTKNVPEGFVLAINTKDRTPSYRYLLVGDDWEKVTGLKLGKNLTIVK